MELNELFEQMKSKFDFLEKQVESQNNLINNLRKELADKNDELKQAGIRYFELEGKWNRIQKLLGKEGLV